MPGAACRSCCRAARSESTAARTTSAVDGIERGGELFARQRIDRHVQRSWPISGRPPGQANRPSGRDVSEVDQIPLFPT